MMEASISTVPASVSTEPRPALKRGWSSRLAHRRLDRVERACRPAARRAPARARPRRACPRAAPRGRRRIGAGAAVHDQRGNAACHGSAADRYHARRDCRPSPVSEDKSRRDRLAAARAADRPLPALPAPGAPSRGGRGGAAAPLSRPALLGAAAAGLRRSARAGAAGGAGAGGARRQSHRADVHRRPERRLALPRAPRGGLRQSAHLDRTPATACGSSGAYITATARCAPPANKPTPGGDGPLPPVPAGGAAAALARAGGGRARQDRLGRLPPRAAGGSGSRVPRPAAPLRPRRGRADAGRRDHAARHAFTRASRTPSPGS